MLSFAISTLFALAFFGSATVIAMMFVQYRGKIVSVIQSELKADQSAAVSRPTAYRHRTVKVSQLMNQHRSLQSAPLRVAA
ncbi:hypothetical protein [Parasphingorhabdus sp.]|uniref:hypothetical protein n=1 Tax=Parasphingorhabdus sp. TaxID=2709688 RepID=UPI003C78D81E